MLMRLKNFTLLFLMGFFGLFTTNLFAQEDSSIDPADIRYWIGEGDHQVVFAVNWNEPDTALAWGFRFNEESVYVKEVMEAIAEADYRFSFEAGGWGVTEITYHSGALNLGLAGMWWMYNVNGITAGLGFDAQPVVDGDFVKFGDIDCATEIAEWTYVWTAPVQPVADNTGVDETSMAMSLYPNPATSYTMLDVQMDQATVTVTDLQGRVLESFVMTQNNEPVRIETANYEAGVYFVTVKNADARHTVKLLVK